MQLLGSLSPSLFRHLSKTLPPSLRHHYPYHRSYARRYHFACCPPPPHFLCLSTDPPPSKAPPRRRRRLMTPTPSAPFSTALSASAAVEADPPRQARTNFKAKNKARRETPEGLLRHRLDMCSKRGDLVEGLRLYDEARAESVPLAQHHYNVLLYLCSSSPSPSSTAPEGEKPVELAPPGLGLKRGFEIFRQMGLDRIQPNEATFTSVARLAAVKEDPDLAFELIRKMKEYGIPPKLRSYGPALRGFCRKGEAEKAYKVEDHMSVCGIVPEDAELAALIQVSSEAGKGEEVYRLLHKLRSLVRQVSESTAEVLESWFKSEAAARVGIVEWDLQKVKEGVMKGGGGWHGQGWFGKGQWSVGRAEMDEQGVCRRCGDTLVCIDIDPMETENFAKSLANLACQKEVKADFVSFQEWLNKHGPFDAVIDGANVGLYKQSNFSFFQINSVVNAVREKSPSKKMPLIILHSRRTKGGPADSPNNKKLTEYWRKSGALYATPYGSNDDWYWLYAAVNCKSLLVTNDEMRDHLFQLLGNSFFPRWKEKHQVRLTFSRRGPSLHMPPPYSIVIQESETGNWHIPTVTGDDVEAPRQWVCATRSALTNLAPTSSTVADKSKRVA